MTADCLCIIICLFSACAEGLMKFDATATEENIKAIVAEHLKHAPQRLGGGGFMPS